MYLEIRHKNNGFHTMQIFPSGNYGTGKGTHSVTSDHTLIGGEGEGL